MEDEGDGEENQNSIEGLEDDSDDEEQEINQNDVEL